MFVWEWTSKMWSAILMVYHLFPLILAWNFPSDHMSSQYTFRQRDLHKKIVIMMAIGLETLIGVIVRHQWLSVSLHCINFQFPFGTFSPHKTCYRGWRWSNLILDWVGLCRAVRKGTSTKCPCSATDSQPPASSCLEISQDSSIVMLNSLWIWVLPSVPQVQAILLVLASQGHPGDLVCPWTENIDYNDS